MRGLINRIKKQLLIRHTKAKLKEYNKRISKTIPWIWRQGLMKNMETHCNVLLNSLLTEEKNQNLRRNKYIVDSILKYNVERSECLIKSNKRIKNMKSFMRLNSYIIFDEVTKGLAEKQNKNTIDFNIRIQLSLAQEKINAAADVEDILNEKMYAEIA